MPGPPRELTRMWTHEVSPRLKERNTGVAIVTRTLKTFGISEGGLNEMVSDLFESANPSLGIYSKEDGIHLRAIATAETDDKARELIVPMEAQIREIVGEAIWGEDDETPETKAAALLLKDKRTLGIMESFTGGLLASSLADVEESSRFLRGSVVAGSDDVLTDHGVDPEVIGGFGAASAETATAMAQAARLRFNADVGIGVTGVVTRPTPHSGPIGTSHIGLSMDGRTATASGRYPTQRLRIRTRAVTHALLELIRLLQG